MRAIHPFEQWKVQRLLAVFDSYAAEVKNDLRFFCDELEASELLALNLPNRLDRQHYKLVRENV